MDGEQGTFAALDQEVVYGSGCLAAGLRRVLSRRPEGRLMIVSGSGTWSDDGLRSYVTDACGGRPCEVFTRPRAEARVDQVLAAMQAARRFRADMLLSVGGGGAIDLAKAAYAGLTYDLDTAEAWNGAYDAWGDPRSAAGGGARPLHVSLPTTLAGAAHTVGFGLVGGWRGKRMYRSPQRGSLPAVVFLDPVATRSAPPDLWRSSAFKALEHAVERSYARPAHPVLDPLATAATVRIVQGLSHGLGAEDPQRLNLLIGTWLAVFGGAGTSRLGLSHVFGRQIGAVGRLPHANLAPVTLIPVMRFNRPAADRALAGLQRAIDATEGRAPGGAAEADRQAASRFIETVERIADRFELPRRWRDLGGDAGTLGAVADGVMQDPGMSDNPVQPTRADVERLLKEMW